MKYQTFTPHPQLSEYIKYYWTLETGSEDGPASKERIFPDGCMELIFHFGDPFKNHSGASTAALMPGSFVYGQLQEFKDIEATGVIAMFSIRFHANGLRPFIRFDISEMTDKTLSVLDCWGKEGEELEDKMLNVFSTNQRICILENFLLNKLRKYSESDRVIGHCINLIKKNQGNINIDKISQHLYISRRQLERKFVTAVGLSPKMFSRITRFQHSLQIISGGKFETLTAIAHDAGYYDQAHFIKDFSAFTGLSPGQYLADKFPLVEYFISE